MSKKVYFVDFDPSYYVLDDDGEYYRVGGFDLFSDEAGYCDQDRAAVQALDLGGVCLMDSGYQSVRRVR
jgi:hypothetical protein